MSAPQEVTAIPYLYQVLTNAARIHICVDCGAYPASGCTPEGDHLSRYHLALVAGHMTDAEFETVLEIVRDGFVPCTTQPPQTVDEVEALYPRWHIWEGVGGEYHARRVLSKPPANMQSDTLVGISELIKAWQTEHRYKSQ